MTTDTVVPFRTPASQPTRRAALAGLPVVAAVERLTGEARP